MAQDKLSREGIYDNSPLEGRPSVQAEEEGCPLEGRCPPTADRGVFFSTHFPQYQTGFTESTEFPD